jgi:hypothetical protein
MVHVVFWKIRGFDEKVKIHPIIVNASPNFMFWRGERAGLPRCLFTKGEAIFLVPTESN